MQSVQYFLKWTIMISIIVLGVISMIPSQANAQQASDAVCESLGAADDGSGDCSGGDTDISGLLATILNILSFIAGFIARFGNLVSCG